MIFYLFYGLSFELVKINTYDYKINVKSFDFRTKQTLKVSLNVDQAFYNTVNSTVLTFLKTIALILERQNMRCA